MLFFDTDIAPSSARYETLARIGRGGMAEVLLAATRANGVVKLSVLKCLWPELAEDAEFVEMFLDEARLCARLAHPNVVQTHEVLQHEGRLALAMEYLDGQPLTRVLARLGSSPAFGLPTRLRIVTSILAALEYAHDLTDFDGRPLGVVHRDVSPHNVIVTYDGHVKLIDFGVAKTLAASHQTRPGGFKGKLAYLAPETVRGEGLDRRADIFSVGVMLWEILAGRRMWGRGSDGVSGAWRLAAGEPAPALPDTAEIPRALRIVTTRALALDPAARYQTAADLGEALERAGADTSDSHARRLGALMCGTFAAEREQRRALIELHLRPTPASPSSGPPIDYESFDVSSAGAPSVEATPGPELTATAEPTPTFIAPPRSAWRRTPFVAAASAAIALFAGVHLGKQTDVPRAPAPTVPGLTTGEPPAAQPEAPPTSVAAATIEPIPEPRDDQPPPAPEHREHRAHRTRPLDLASDDVLGLDGNPLAATGSASGSSRNRHD
jgi:serine/threonine-protein kinase